MLFETKATVRAATTQTPAKEENIYLLDSVFFLQNVLKMWSLLHIT